MKSFRQLWLTLPPEWRAVILGLFVLFGVMWPSWIVMG